MNKKIKDKVFFVSWIIETYKRHHQLTGKETIALFQRYRIDEWLFQNYGCLHTVSSEYVVTEIDEIIQSDLL